jgi:hypothetical protein
VSEEKQLIEVHRVTLYVVDHDGIGGDGARRVLENTRYPNRCIHPHVSKVETREVAWHDRHPINMIASMYSALDQLFSEGG